MNSIHCACFTGHRPERFGSGANPFQTIEESLKQLLTDEIIRVIDRGCSTFYCGMARGVDLLAGEVVISLQTLYPHIRLVAVIPFPKQPYYWEDEWIARYNRVLHRCAEMVTISNTFSKASFALRNQYMVNHSDYVIAVCNPKQLTGGTAQTIGYAKQQGKTVVTICYNNDIFTT